MRRAGEASRAPAEGEHGEVIQAAEHCDKSLARSLVAQALQKDVNARDAIFNRIAWQPDRAVRDCIRRRVEAIQEIVKALILLARGGDGSP